VTDLTELSRLNAAVAAAVDTVYGRFQRDPQSRVSCLKLTRPRRNYSTASGHDCVSIANRMNVRAQEIASGLPTDLDSLPRLRGFRLRGIAMTRLETFIDAAFAFAITMLVIAAQQIPDDIETLLAAFENVPAFVTSIAVLGIFWRGHWLWSRRYGLEDGVSIFVSWAMIVTILIYIYPLKAIFSSMWFSLSDGRVGHVLGPHSETEMRALFAVFALGFSAISLEMLLLNFHAWQLREPLQLNARERAMTFREVTGWSIPVAVGMVSLVLALSLPREQIEWSGWIYFSMVFLVPIHRAFPKRKAKHGALS
jgi:Endosomal/lysosomal potassium channel TMEM175